MVAVATHPYVIDPATKAYLQKKMPGQELARDQDWLREQLGFMGLKIPTLFKQYADVCKTGGVRFCGFNVDPAFNHCVDGLVMVDLRYLKPNKRARYIGSATIRVQIDKCRLLRDGVLGFLCDVSAFNQQSFILTWHIFCFLAISACKQKGVRNGRQIEFGYHC